MRSCWKIWAVPVLLSLPVAGLAATCTTQAVMQPQEREQLSAVALRLSGAILQQDFGALQNALLPAESSQWETIRAAAEQAVPLLTGGQVQLDNLYLLDASTQTSAEDTEFFCSNASGSITVTISMRGLPPGKYAVALAESTGAALDGRLGLILAWGGDTDGWKLAGLAAHQGTFDGHDGVWYWTHARALRDVDPWVAWYTYDAARYLLLPVDYLSSSNLEKLEQEQSQISPKPANSFPLSLPDGDRIWKIDAVVLDPSLHEPDLGVAYESTGVTDPAALHTEAIAVMSAFLKTQPGIRANFHGLWAYSVKDGKRSPVMELPMAKIP